METKRVVEEFGRHQKDCGSVEVQIALLTSKIVSLASTHFSVHKKDKHGYLGLVKMVGRRKKLLSYLKKCSVRRYDAILKRLGI